MRGTWPHPHTPHVKIVVLVDSGQAALLSTPLSITPGSRVGELSADANERFDRENKHTVSKGEQGDLCGYGHSPTRNKGQESYRTGNITP